MSSFAWLAFSEAERRQTLDALSGLKDQDTRDELGLGAIRDALSDSLFPGTSTLTTRARYLLLISWAYRRMEDRRVSSTRAAGYARNLELDTAEVLTAWNPDAGVIGSQAGRSLLRLPSAVYWQPLGEWSIRRFVGGQAAYLRSLDSFYGRARDSVGTDTEDEAQATAYRNWDDQLPVPSDFPQGETLDLTAEEATYLRERYRLRHSDSLLCWLIDNVSTPIPEQVVYPWELSQWLPTELALPQRLAERLEHAELFSLTTYGGILLYNAMLTEKLAKGDPEYHGARDEYLEQLKTWRSEMNAEQERLERWLASIDRLWDVVEDHAAGSTWRSQRVFAEQLLQVSIDPTRRSGLATDSEVRDLVYNREIELKRGLARLAGGRSLDTWGGGSGLGRHRFRWHRARVITNDIIEGVLHDAVA